MIRLTLKEVAEACGGRLEGADPDTSVAAVTIDSRSAGPGALFVALRGRRDGHEFVADALSRGAVAALVAAASPPAATPAIRVDDPLESLARLAGAVRTRLAARVVAITGSSGKTITKDFTAAAVATRHRVVASHASYNNEIGLPLTLLAADDATEVIVAEMAARHQGDIASLARIARPDVGVVLNVGVAHLGIFGSREGIARAKGELVEALEPGGVAVLNADDPLVAAMAERTRVHVCTFGRDPAAGVRAEEVRLDAGARAGFRVVAAAGALPGCGPASAEVRLPAPGEHLVEDALAALAAGLALGVPLDASAGAIGAAVTQSRRMEVREAPGGWRILDDAYNANPQSSAAALKTLIGLRTRGAGAARAWAILGPMAELGAASASEHDRIGRLAVRLGVDRLVTVGDETAALHEAARHEGMPPGEILRAATAHEAAALVRAGIAPGDIVLVKGSRVAGLEVAVEELMRA